MQKLKDEPDASSATSISQTSQINFKSGTDSIISKDGDQIYVYINGNKVSQNYLLTSASQGFREDLWNSLSLAEQAAEPGANGLVDPAIPAPSPTTPAYEASIAAYDRAASKIATYKALADKISQIPGLVANTIRENPGTGASADVLETDDTFVLSTYNIDMLKGIIQIKSLIPGKEFVISEVAEQSGNAINQGAYQTTSVASKGSGIGALESSKDALAKLITGKQQDVYTTTNLDVNGNPKDYTYSISIYDKELKVNVPIPNNGAIPPVAIDVFIDNANSIDEIAAQINNNPDLSKHVVARNVNGNLVVETLDSNYDVEFMGNLKIANNNLSSIDAFGVVTLDPSTTFAPIDINGNYSGRKGAGAEFIEIINKVDQTASKGSLQLRLDTLKISDSAFGEFSVDSTGLITMKQDGAEFAVGQVAIAVFNNNRGLNTKGDNLLAKTNESGDPVYNLNNNKTAKIESKTLELSTADLSESLVNLMVFQRAFEANAKSITTSDELLNTLINLKR